MKNSYLNTYAWCMICVSSFARLQNQTILWFFYVNGCRANFNDLEIPCRWREKYLCSKIKLFTGKKFLNVTPSSKVDVGDVSQGKKTIFSLHLSKENRMLPKQISTL